MAQYRLNAYDADVFIPEFKGLMQYGDQMGTDLRFSPDCMNVETPGGVLQPAPGLESFQMWDFTENKAKEIGYGYNKITHARMTNCGEDHAGSKYQYTNSSGNPTTPISYWIEGGAEYEAYLVFAGRTILEAIVSINQSTGQPDIYGADGTLAHTGLKVEFNTIKEFGSDTGFDNGTSAWSYCVYEYVYPDPVNEGDPSGKTNVILITNPVYGMWMYSGFGTITNISSAPQTMRYITQYAERIWGIGSNSGGDQDVIYYSRPYDLTDWTENNDDPENGGGMIREATFDKDSLVSMVRFADSLIVFSKLRAWRITGTDPSNFYIQEQYGNGTPFPDSIAVMGDMVVMLGYDGILAYNGSSVSPFLRSETYDVLKRKRMTQWNIRQVSAISLDDKYILYLGDLNQVLNPRQFLIYNRTDGSVLLVDSPEVHDFCVDDPYILALSANNVFDGVIYLVRFDSFSLKNVTSSATKWTTPWIDLSRKDIQKGGFELYFYPELNTTDTTATVTLKFTIQTEKKKKSKSYVVHALTSDERTADKKHKQKRLHFGGAGRRFRLTIETAAGNTVPWRLIGGIHIIAEIDKD